MASGLDLHYRAFYHFVPVARLVDICLPFIREKQAKIRYTHTSCAIVVIANIFHLQRAAYAERLIEVTISWDDKSPLKDKEEGEPRVADSYLAHPTLADRSTGPLVRRNLSLSLSLSSLPPRVARFPQT